MTELVAAAIVLASGGGTRFGGGPDKVNKVYVPLAGRSVISWSVNTLMALPEVGPLVLVIRPGDRELADRVLQREIERPGVELVPGGATRQESELCGLRHLRDRIEAGELAVVLIHDGARPLVSPALASRVVRTAHDTGGAVPGLPREGLVRVSPDGEWLDGAPPDGLVAVQTPQAFRAGPLLAAYEEAARVGFDGTDTESCVARFTEVRTRWITGEPHNIKITYPHDLPLAERLLVDLR